MDYYAVSEGVAIVVILFFPLYKAGQIAQVTELEKRKLKSLELVKSYNNYQRYKMPTHYLSRKKDDFNSEELLQNLSKLEVMLMKK